MRVCGLDGAFKLMEAFLLRVMLCVSTCAWLLVMVQLDKKIYSVRVSACCWKRKRFIQDSLSTQALRHSSHSSSASSWGQSALGLNGSLLQGYPQETWESWGVELPLTDRDPAKACTWEMSSRRAEQALSAFPAQLWELGLAELGCSCRWVRRKGYVRWDWRRTRDAWVQRYQWEDPSGQVLSVQPASPSYARVFWAICSLTALCWHVEVGGRECTRGRLSFAGSWPKLLSWLQQINKFLKHVKVMFNKLILHPRKFSLRISTTAEKSLGKYSLQWVALWFWDENSSWKASGCLLYGRAGKVPSSMRRCSCTARQLPMLSGCGSREAQEPAGRSCLRALQPCPATTIASLPQAHLCQQRGHCSLVSCAAVSVLGLLSDPVPLAVLVRGTVVAQQSNADHINIE